MELYRGKVVKIEGDYAIVLSDTGAFHSIKIKGHMVVSQEIIYTDYDFVKIKNKSSIKKRYYYVALVASLLLVIYIGCIFHNPSPSLYAIVSIDINPSVDLYLDKDLQVTKIKAHNIEGQKIISNELLNRPLEDVISNIVKNSEDNNYITNNKNSILVSTSVIEYNVDVNTIKDTVTNAVQQTSHNEINLYSIDVENIDMNKWKESKMSIGMYEMATKYNYDRIKERTSVTELMEEYETIKDNVNINKQIIKPLKNKKDQNKDSEKDINNKVNIDFDNKKQDFIKKIINEKNKIKDNIDHQDHEANDVDDKMDGVIDQIEETINQVDDGIDETIDQVGDKVNETIDEVEDKIEETTDQVEDKVDETIDQVEDKVDETINEVEDKVDETIDEVENKVDETIDQVGDKVDETIDQVGDKVDETIDQVEDKIEESIDEVEDMIDERIDQADDEMEEVLDNVEKKLNKIINGLGD
jgi:ElaB/YqjD/DUF883 family membrane-anchored ribosome-binding protein